jgi:hypothetical protein
MFSMTGQYEHPLHTFPRSSCQRGGEGKNSPTELYPSYTMTLPLK